MTSARSARARKRPSPAKTGPPIDASALERVLVVDLDNLGDLVFCSSWIEPLRRVAPRARIDLWCKDYTAPIARLIPGVERVHAADPFWDRAPGRGKGAFAPFLRSARDVRACDYQIALLASSQWRVALAVRATGVPLRVGLARHRNGPLLTHVLPAADVDAPVLAELGRVLGPLGIGPQPFAYRLDAAPLADRRQRVRAALGGARPVALHAFASKRERCMDLGEWIALGRSLRAEGHTVLWIGSPRELDEVRARLASDDAWSFGDRLGETGLDGLAVTLAECRLFVGNDSGPLHVANALGVPCVGVFAPGQPKRTFPQGVAPWRLVARPSPAGLGANDVLPEARALLG